MCFKVINFWWIKTLLIHIFTYEIWVLIHSPAFPKKDLIFPLSKPFMINSTEVNCTIYLSWLLSRILGYSICKSWSTRKRTSCEEPRKASSRQTSGHCQFISFDYVQGPKCFFQCVLSCLNWNKICGILWDILVQWHLLWSCHVWNENMYLAEPFNCLISPSLFIKIITTWTCQV